MKYLSILLILSAWVPLATCNEEHPCQMTYSVDIYTMHADDVVIPCDADAWDRMTNVIHSVVELDVIASMLGTEVGEFVAAYERLGELAFMDLLNENQTVTEEELKQHLEVSDVLDDMYYNGCGEEDLKCAGLESSVEDGDDAARRRLQDTMSLARELMKIEKEADRIADHKFFKHQRRRLKERGIIPVEEGDEFDDQEVDVDQDEWTPVDQDVDFTGRRRLKKKKKMNCGKQGSCKADWCCTICGHNCRRRRLQHTRGGAAGRIPDSQQGATLASIQPAATSLTNPPSSQASEVASSLTDPPLPEEKTGTSSGKAVRTVEGGPDAGSTDAVLIAKFEHRVSRALRDKLRRLARHGLAPCLGQFWQLEVFFERNWFEVL